MRDGATPGGLSLLHADDALLVFDKPSGLLSVPGRGPDLQDCLITRAQRAYPDALIVHRLDMATSGLIVLARGPEVQRRLSAAFEKREVQKTYVAVVHGEVQGPRLIDLPILVDWPNRPKRTIDAAGQPSRTGLRVLSYDVAHDTSRLQLVPETGRTHQLRVHLQAIGHPILGDALYAPPELVQAAPRLLLHACGLGLAHPTTGLMLEWSCPAPF